MDNNNQNELIELRNKHNNEFLKIERSLNTLYGNDILMQISKEQHQKARQTAFNELYQDQLGTDSITQTSFIEDIADSKKDLKDLIDNNNLPLEKRIEYREVYNLIQLVESKLNNEDKINNAFLAKNLSQFIDVVLDNTLTNKEKLNKKELLIKKAYDRTSLNLRQHTYKKISKLSMRVAQSANYFIEESIGKVKNNIVQKIDEFKNLKVFVKMKNLFNKLSRASLFTSFVGNEANKIINNNEPKENVSKMIENNFNNDFNVNLDITPSIENKSRKRYSL